MLLATPKLNIARIPPLAATRLAPQVSYRAAFSGGLWAGVGVAGPGVFYLGVSQHWHQWQIYCMSGWLLRTFTKQKSQQVSSQEKGVQIVNILLVENKFYLVENINIPYFVKLSTLMFLYQDRIDLSSGWMHGKCLHH